MLPKKTPSGPLSLSLSLCFSCPKPNSLYFCPFGEKMGKYMKKSKEGEVAVVMEVSSIGICTRRRAKSLLAAAQKPQPKSDSSSLSYLQLRSRRLHKPPPLLLTTTPPSTKPKPKPKPKPQQQPHTISISNSTLFDSASFGDNYLDFDARDRFIL